MNVQNKRTKETSGNENVCVFVCLCVIMWKKKEKISNRPVFGVQPSSGLACTMSARPMTLLGAVEEI
jgi:hypothetical protein